jgi:hypothetical protein
MVLLSAQLYRFISATLDLLDDGTAGMCGDNHTTASCGNFCYIQNSVAAEHNRPHEVDYSCNIKDASDSSTPAGPYTTVHPTVKGVECVEPAQ